MSKRNEVQPMKSVLQCLFKKPCLQAAPEWQKWWRVPDGWWKTVPSTCSCHGKRTVAERLVNLTTRVGESADRRWRRLPSADVRNRSSARYGGAVQWRHRYANTHNLNLTRSWTHNQWRSLSSGEMWSVLLAVKIRRAAAFRTDCNRSWSCTDIPARSELQ